MEHVALTKGEWTEDEPVLIRVHSSCATGDIFGSYRCDCGEQLHRAMQMIQKEGKGAIVYLNQEGRGIGLCNKIHAYKLQDEGLDTVDANLRLGFKADERDYGVGASIIRELGIRHMRLMTNNPLKRAGLEGYGLKIDEIVPIVIAPNKYNEHYLETKQERMHHTLGLEKNRGMDPKQLRIVFMGTPEFAVPSLRALVAGGYRVVAVVTTPDKPAGRGQKMHESDVKAAARELGLPILQPEKLKAGEFVDAMRELRPDLGIVIAFRMLPEVIWAMPRLGTFNLHASLLPQYRGAAPINWAIINGERQTGVTTFLLNHEIDKGAILGQIKVPILDEDNVGTLYEKLMTVGTGLVLETVDRVAAGDITPTVQENADEATLHPAPKIFKEDCRIDWHREGRRIIDFIRGLSPYPAAWTGMFRDGSDEMQTAKIFAATFEEAAHGAPCGTVESDGRTFIRVACSDGWIVLGELQIAGKNASRCASSCWAGATCCNTVSNRGAGKTRSRPPECRRPIAFYRLTKTGRNARSFRIFTIFAPSNNPIKIHEIRPVIGRDLHINNPNDAKEVPNNSLSRPYRRILPQPHGDELHLGVPRLQHPGVSDPPAGRRHAPGASRMGTQTQEMAPAVCRRGDALPACRRLVLPQLRDSHAAQFAASGLQPADDRQQCAPLAADDRPVDPPAAAPLHGVVCLEPDA